VDTVAVRPLSISSRISAYVVYTLKRFAPARVVTGATKFPFVVTPAKTGGGANGAMFLHIPVQLTSALNRLATLVSQSAVVF
jgi:hypothetical protein